MVWKYTDKFRKENCRKHKTRYKHQRKSKSSEWCFFYGVCRLVISSTADCKYKFLHVCLMFCCFSWLIRFVVYRSNQSINADGINRSGSFIIILNNKSSNLECSLWRNSFTMLRFLISMSIIITSEKIFVLFGKSELLFLSIL